MYFVSGQVFDCRVESLRIFCGIKNLDVFNLDIDLIVIALFHVLNVSLLDCGREDWIGVIVRVNKYSLEISKRHVHLDLVISFIHASLVLLLTFFLNFELLILILVWPIVCFIVNYLLKVHF